MPFPGTRNWPDIDHSFFFEIATGAQGRLNIQISEGLRGLLGRRELGLEEVAEGKRSGQIGERPMFPFFWAERGRWVVGCLATCSQESSPGTPQR